MIDRLTIFIKCLSFDGLGLIVPADILFLIIVICLKKEGMEKELVGLAMIACNISVLIIWEHLFWGSSIWIMIVPICMIAALVVIKKLISYNWYKRITLTIQVVLMFAVIGCRAAR